MKAASSLVRNDMVPTRSSGTSPRLIACMVATEANSSSMLERPARGVRASVPAVLFAQSMGFSAQEFFNLDEAGRKVVEAAPQVKF